MTLINHQGHAFIPVRSDYWAILEPYGWTKTITAAACKVLAVLEGWTQFVQERGRSEVKMSIRQLTEAIKEHGIRTISKAAQLLADTSFINREKKTPTRQQGAWENPALTWWYQLDASAIQTAIDGLDSQAVTQDITPPEEDNNTNCSNPQDEALDPFEPSDRSEEQKIVENLLEKSSENPSKENNVSATTDFFEEEVNQDELKAMEIDPEEVKQCINKNSFNYKWALFQLKKFYVTGKCENPTGFLMSRLRMSRLSCRREKSSAPANFQKCPKPNYEQLEELCERYGNENVGQTILDIPDMGYPLTWVVVVGEQYLPWWEVTESFNSFAT